MFTFLKNIFSSDEHGEITLSKARDLIQDRSVVYADIRRMSPMTQDYIIPEIVKNPFFGSKTFASIVIDKKHPQDDLIINKFVMEMIKSNNHYTFLWDQLFKKYPFVIDDVFVYLSKREKELHFPIFQEFEMTSAQFKILEPFIQKSCFVIREEDNETKEEQSSPLKFIDKSKFSVFTFPDVDVSEKYDLVYSDDSKITIREVNKNTFIIHGVEIANVCLKKVPSCSFLSPSSHMECEAIKMHNIICKYGGTPPPLSTLLVERINGLPFSWSVEISGYLFNKLVDKFNLQLVKLTNEEEKHNGFQYKDELNIDAVPFNPTFFCQPGGLYFTEKRYTEKWSTYNKKTMKYIRNVTIPSDARVFCEGDKFKADKFILSPREPLDKNNDLSESSIELSSVFKNALKN